jgi:dTDP-glucose pyrophosphorylase
MSIVESMRIAVVPAAGKGTRLGRIGAAIPKALVPIAGRPAIDHILQMLHEASIEQIMLIVGYKKEQLISYIDDGSEFGLKVAYVTQPDPKGIAHALLWAEPFVNEDFLCLLGDTLLFPAHSLKNLVQFHESRKPAATLFVKDLDDITGYGVIEPDGEKVKKVVEKPRKGQAPSNLAIVGCYAFSPRIFKAAHELPPNPRTGEMELTDAVQRLIDWGEDVLYVKFNGTYIDTGKLDQVRSADRLVRGFEIFNGRSFKIRLDRIPRNAGKTVAPLFKGPTLESTLTVLQKGESTSGHRHFDAEEIYIFVEGECLMQTGNEEHDVKPGDAVVIAPGDFHRVFNVGNGPISFVAVYPTSPLRECK